MTSMTARMRRMVIRWLRDERGSAILFTTGMLFILLAFVGIAVDIAYLTTAHGEVQRSMDAAALAGAGNLGFNDTVFPNARAAAANFGLLNPYRNPNGGTITLNQNAGNAANGNIVLGIYNGLTSTFTPSLDGTMVNAVRCQYSTTIPTTFLRFAGVQSLAINAMSTATSNPPSTIPPTACLFPIAVTQCPFSAGGGSYGSAGCGQPISTFTPSTTNTAAWLSPDPNQGPNNTNIMNAIQAAYAGGSNCSGSQLDAGDQGQVNNGAFNNVFNGTGQQLGLGKCQGGPDPATWNCSGMFNNKFNDGTSHTVNDAQGNPMYSGPGWEVHIAVVQTSCPPGPMNQTLPIMTFTRMVITQVINGGRCVVNNHYSGNIWDQYCTSPDGTVGASANDPSLNAVFGYYECTQEATTPTPIPAPRAAIATRLQLVQ